MSAARNPLPAPDMSGLAGDFKTLRDLRAASDRHRDQEQEPVSDVTTSRRHDATGDRQGEEHDGHQEHGAAAPEPTPTPRRRTASRRPAPRAADAVALTVRLDPEESDEVDAFLLWLRREAGLRRLDKAEAVRELLRLAREHEPTAKALIRRLR
ncbi:hypothetical protein ACFU8I_31700 [Streptomyces sp. NPDC057540]|uniref:hypothetical protein n=1 Tax=Streptomyces sp. NPDC057540 TaxID=3346160 RepID=UPI00369C504C